MAFYESISPLYDYIFPLNKNQVEFVKTLSPNKGRLIEIGCGTGSLVNALNIEGYVTEGIDLDSEMLSYAEKKYPNLKFTNMNMLDINKYYEKEMFDTVVCFGNTLVHLDNIEQIKLYFERVFNIIKSGGIFLIQIINYDRIIEEKIDCLPKIDNEKISFVRDYFHREDGYIDFNTILTDKEKKIEIKNSQKLLPIRKDEVKKALTQAGFKNISFYGSFKMDKFNEKSSYPLIIKVEK